MKGFTVFPGEIIVSCAGTIGETYVLPQNIEKGIINQALMKISLNINIDTNYFLNYFDFILKNEAIENSQGSAIKNIPPFDILKELYIAIPPIPEQKRIAETVENLLGIVDTIESDKIDLSELIKQTKAKVLDLVIKGKLVPQDPNDEPADKLLEKIREEKEKLIEEGKLKRDKNETFIYKNNDDNSYYEQIDGETVGINDDLPFEIPQSWRWCRLGNIGDWGAGATPNRNKPEYYNNGMIPWLKTGDLNDGYINTIPEYITEQALKETSVCIKPKGTILIAMYGATIGKLGILNIDSTTNQACCACQCIYINNLYLFYYLMSQRNNFKKMGMGGAQPNISRELLVNYYFALPPINEQLKIVSKIKDIFAQLDTIQEIFNK